MDGNKILNIINFILSVCCFLSGVGTRGRSYPSIGGKVTVALNGRHFVRKDLLYQVLVAIILL